MFRRFTQSNPDAARALFQLHPADVSALLDLAWNFQVHDTNKELGDPDRRSDLPGLPNNFLNSFPAVRANLDTRPVPLLLDGRVRWDHLIYAYMIENTRIYEVFRRVVHECLHGEQLGAPNDEAQFWLRNTEQLFYTDQPLYFITHLTSHIRRDLIATRRDAYYRMFGMDVIHGKGDDQTYPYEKAKVSNTDFVATFEEFLREVWVAIANRNNDSGENPIDEAAIANLATRLHDMLRARRQNGNLAREEFTFVSMMSWFHLSVEFNDSPIVVSLRAEASSPEQRLVKIGERVRLKVPAMAKSFFDIADPISRLLIFLETDQFASTNASSGTSVLFQDGPIQNDIRDIITHWSLTTGRDLKVRRTQARPQVAVPV